MNTILNIARSSVRSGWLPVLVVCAALPLAGCGGGDSGAEQTRGGQTADAPAADHAHDGHQHDGHDHAAAPAAGAVTLAGVTFTPPAGWQDLGPSGMRAGQFRIEPAAGGGAPAEVNLFYFGPASGGGVEANLQRWIGQMVLPDGGDPSAAAQRSSFTADGMPGHVVSLDGTYKSGGGRPMGGATEMLPGYRLVGVVLEGPQGSLFFKLTGPEATAKAAEGDLLAMVQSAHK